MHDESAQITADIVGYLEGLQQKELLRFVAVGSVDDGKSTLIGRLLHDTHGVYEDQLSAARRATKQEDQEIDFSLLTDGLKAEREQGITIDVAYRYFSTAKRKFIIADTPGHVQYTRNMATGASTADVAIILIDARLGVLQQSRRHAYIASLLGIPHLFVCVNKMDLVAYEEARYEAIVAEFAAFAAKLSFESVSFTPISALRGENLVHASQAMPWYSGPPLLAQLEELPIRRGRTGRAGGALRPAPRGGGALRFPVQYVLRPHLDYRGFAGQVAAGSVSPGDEVMVLPSRQRTRVVSIDTYDGAKPRASAPMSVTLRLQDEVDVSRGDMLVSPEAPPEVTHEVEAMLVWLSERPLDLQKTYFVKHTTQYSRARIHTLHYRTDLSTLEHEPATELAMNDIGRITLHAHRPLFIDPYEEHRITGAFIVIDSLTNNTVGAGMIVPREQQQGVGPAGLIDGSQVSPAERAARLGHPAGLVTVTGGEAEQLRELCSALERQLFDRGRFAVMVAPTSPLTEETQRELCIRLLALGAFVVWSGELPPELTLPAGLTPLALSAPTEGAEGRQGTDLDRYAADWVSRALS
ncbi:MAG: sulfate adenylyltransferase subunit CysN [Polyangiaceae bacterium]|nr:sulfate adenylyltransferase subunit CysN [Polyangiaceae bacterium]MCW5789478.1 sulfate adenylyltransferase subunit CysN [Polyangiaceae bacterium]